MKQKIYLDYASTSPVDKEVLKAMLPYFSDKFGNPSSIHSFGQEGKFAIEKSRSNIARFFGAAEEEIIFTASGTEANNFVLFGVADALKQKGNHIIISSIEHHAVLEPAKILEKNGYKITKLKVDKYGIVDVEDLKKSITDKTILVSIIYASNEIGTIEPIEAISKITKEKGVYLHTDAVQTVGHIPINVSNLGIDLLSLSAHKFYGPKGVGALYLKRGTKINRYIHGGDQERRMRSSTENVPGIVGMAKALEICNSKIKPEMLLQTKLRDKLIKGIQENIPDAILNGHPTNRLCNNVNFSFKGIESEPLLINLDLEGIAASSGSACTYESLAASHVLLAIGQKPKLARGALRLTLGRHTKESDIYYCLEKLPKIIQRLRR